MVPAEISAIYRAPLVAPSVLERSPVKTAGAKHGYGASAELAERTDLGLHEAKASSFAEDQDAAEKERIGAFRLEECKFSDAILTFGDSC